MTRRALSQIALAGTELPFGFQAAGRASQGVTFDASRAESDIGLFRLQRHLACAFRAFAALHNGFWRGLDFCFQRRNAGFEGIDTLRRLLDTFPQRPAIEEGNYV